MPSRDEMLTELVARVVEACEDGVMDKADGLLRHAVHVGVRPIEIFAAVLAAPAAQIEIPAQPTLEETQMRVTYIGPGAGRRLAPALGDIWCPQGEPVDVPDDIGRRLIAQRVFVKARPQRERTKPAGETPERAAAGETPERADPISETRDA